MPLDPISYSLIKSKNNAVNIVYSTTEPTDKDVIWFDLNHNRPRLYNTKSGKWGYLLYTEGYTGFDNNLDGFWTNYIRIPITTPPTESVQYKIEIDGNTIRVYANNGTTILTSANIGSYFWDSVQPDGSDIRVFDEARVQKYFWIETFNYTSHKMVIWVKIDAGQEQINIAYGNDSCISSTYNDINSVFVKAISNLIGCWHFDEGTGTKTHDYSGYGRDGILKGKVSWTTNGYRGNAVSFNGGYVEMANSTNMDGYSQLTVICRVYPTGFGTILSKDSCYELVIGYEYNVRWAVHNPSYSTWINTGIKLNLKTWYTIAWVYESARSIKTYVYDRSGNLKTHTGSFGSGNIATSGYRLRIGNKTVSYYSFKGTIDEVYMFDRALTREEIEMIRLGICRGSNNGKLLICKHLSHNLSFGTPTIEKFNVSSY